MLRHLITLLAVITGLAAVGAPAMASVRDIENAGFVTGAEASAKSTIPAAILPETPRLATRRAADPVRIAPPPRVRIASVLLVIDRAHE
jgi:hypothetical protein